MSGESRQCGRSRPCVGHPPAGALATVPAGAAALIPAALGLLSPAPSACGVSFPGYSPKRGCLPGAAVTRVAARSAPSGRRQAPSPTRRRAGGKGPVVLDGAQRAAGLRSAGVLMVCCKCAQSRALTILLLRGRGARSRHRLGRPEGRGPAAPRRPPARSPQAGARRRERSRRFAAVAAGAEPPGLSAGRCYTVTPDRGIVCN